MAWFIEKIDADISIYDKARKKFDKCDYKDKFYEIGYCRLFHYLFDTSRDMLHHCGSCKANTTEPSTKKKNVRVP